MAQAIVGITVYGRTPIEFEKIVRTKMMSIEQGIYKLAQETQDQMRQAIVANIKRPGSMGDLVRAINVERNGNEVGVGRVALLPPYWRAVNYGSSHMVGKQMPVGGFVPGPSEPLRSAFREGRFYVGFTPGIRGSYAPIVKMPIPAMNYIEKTKAWLILVRRIRFASWVK